IFLALALAFVMIWIAYKPQVSSKATEQTEEAGAALAPSPSATPEILPSTAPSVPAEEPAPQPSTQAAVDKDAGGGGGDGGGEPKPKPKPKPLLPAENVMLYNTTTKMCAELVGREKGKPDDPVQQSMCIPGDEDNQMWDLEVRYAKGGPEGVQLFQIRNTKDKLCMDLPWYGGAAVGTPVTEYHCDGTKADNQLWWIDKQESGDYWIRNYASNHKCLNVEGNGTGGLDAKLNISDCTNIDDQEWRIVHPKKE
ncbi:RICIN domain-containing protein, partial [Streptomyces parvulus]|uniref:RICIN domain-containing protein n=1 Tax=Streptomyces parvulus TaxID=146923 RepID=UPI003EB7D22E